MVFECLVVYYCGDQVYLVFGGGSDEVVICFVGMVGFDVVDVQVVILQQVVMVQLVDVVEGEFFFMIDGVFVWYVVDQCLVNQCYVVCGVVLFVSIKIVNGLEMGVFQVQSVDVVVYQVDEGVLVVGDVVGYCYVGIVIGLQVNIMDQLRNWYLYVWFEEYQRRVFENWVVGGSGIVVDGDQIGFFEFVCFYCLIDNIVGYYFGQIGWVVVGVGIVFSQYFVRVVIDKDSGFGVNLWGVWDYCFDIQVIGVGSGGECCNGECCNE